jgi:excisionase family DNA binding protein
MERARGDNHEPGLDRHQPWALESQLGDAPALLRPNDVARLLSVSRAWVYEAARTGRIPSVRLGGDDGPLRFVAEDLVQWLADARAAWMPGQRGWSTSSPEIRLRRKTDSPVPGQQSLI